MHRLRNGGITALIALAAMPAAAAADQTIFAGPPTQFIAGDISISQGEKVTFTNLDTVTHDVTAKAVGADGKPVFGSALTDPVGSQPVAGTEYLTSGAYQYYCSIHPYMTGTITVTSSGTPAPRPGGAPTPPPGGSGAAPAQQASSSPARGAPSIHLSVLDTRLAAVRRRGALRVSLSSDQPATIGVSARSGKTVVAAGTARLFRTGSSDVALKLTAAGTRLVKRAHALTVSVLARAAGSAASASTAAATKTLR
jgi:plastocyanin